MSGFSLEWLSLREPVDHRSVNADVRAAFAADMNARPHQRITDIGCGSGSHLRSLAPHLGAHQRWRLVDYDANLLRGAQDELTRWADKASVWGDELRLTKDGRVIEVAFVQADLLDDLERVLDAPADAVTAAAFFDLASPAFIERFAGSMCDRSLPFYTILTYDGREIWRPRHGADEAMLAAFHAHQATDKGFGGAAGPRATDRLDTAFAGRGWRVTRSDSPWLMTEADRPLMSELARGVAAAVRETGRVASETIDGWLAAHLEAQGCEIGHQDIYARPS